MKQYIQKIRTTAFTFIALAMASLMSMQVCAESGDSFLLDEVGNVTLVSEHAAKEGIASLQFEIVVNASDGAEVSFEFAESKADICEYRYNKSTGILNIYIAGKNALFEKDVENLVLGKIKVTGGENSPVMVKIAEDSLKYVYGTDLKTMEGVGLPDEVQLGGGSSTNPPPEETPVPPAETPVPPAATPVPPPANPTPSPGNSAGTAGGQGNSSSGTTATAPPKGNSAGSTVNGNGNNGSTPAPVNTDSPKRTPEPQQPEDTAAEEAEPEETMGAVEPDLNEIPVMNDNSDGQEQENGKKKDYLLPIVLGVTAVLCILGVSLIIISVKNAGKKAEE